MDKIKFSCKCGRKLAAPLDKAGRKARCPTCGAIVAIPSGAATSERPHDEYASLYDKRMAEQSEAPPVVYEPEAEPDPEPEPPEPAQEPTPEPDPAARAEHEGRDAAEREETPKSDAPERPTKNCRFCGEKILADALKCKHCGSDLGPPKKSFFDEYPFIFGPPGPARVMRIAVPAVLLVVLFLCLGFFHCVIGTERITIVLKDHFTFAGTFLTVDDHLKRFNQARGLEQMRISESKLHRALLEKEMIRTFPASERARSRPDHEPLLTHAKLTMISHSLTQQSGSLYRFITGTVLNSGNDTCKYALIQFNLYDAEGSIVGSTLASASHLEPGGTWKFEAPIGEEKAVTYKLVSLEGY